MSCLTLLRRSAWCCRPTWRAPWLSLSSLEFRPLHRHWDSSWPTHTWSVSTRSRIWIGRFLPSQNISYVALDKMYKSLESKYWTVEKQKKTDLCHPSGSSGPRRWNSKPQTPWKIFTKMKEISHLTSHQNQKTKDRRILLTLCCTATHLHAGCSDQDDGWFIFVNPVEESSQGHAVLVGRIRCRGNTIYI